MSLPVPGRRLHSSLLLDSFLSFFRVIFSPSQQLSNLTQAITNPTSRTRMSDADVPTHTPDSPSKLARIAKEPLVEECLQLQQSLTELANKLEQVERSNTATLSKNNIMEQLVEDLIFKVGAVKQVGTSPATKLKNPSPRNKR